MNWDGESWDFAALNDCYKAQFEIESFRELTEKVPTLAIWDDHDCGVNNVRGAEVPKLVMQSRKLFDRWMGFAINAGRPEMYDVYEKLPDVRVLMLDCRSNRTLPDAADPTMLGVLQEEWLWKQLDPAQTIQRPITILANGVGLSQGSPTEVVKAYPDFWGRLRSHISFRDATSDECGRRALFLAGDIHRNHFQPYEDERIYEVLSSGVACFIPKTYHKQQFTPDRFTDNWGLITIEPESVRIDCHGRPDKPGEKHPNNFNRVIRRLDWRLVP